MVDAISRFPTPLRLFLCSAVLLGSGCSYVKRDDFESEVARLRQEMRTGDQALDSRIVALEARLDAVAEELDALGEEFDLTVERLETSLRVHTPIHFGFDETSLDGAATPVLERLAAVLGEYYPDALVTVEGFTDPAGSAAYNLRLGQARAEEVREHLVATGRLTGTQVRAVSYGEASERLVRPGASGPGDAGRENRRAVIVIDHPTEGASRTLVSSTSD